MCNTTQSALSDISAGPPNMWLAPAKLNLFLHIIGRREDGYHLLQTVFQFIDFYDRLQFTVCKDGVISRETKIAGIDADCDLTVKAAKLLQSTAKTPLGAAIRIEKNIPMGAGLGGGSSDAATTLIALNSLWQLKFSVTQLATLGLELGADVPVFVHGHAAWAEGVGELLTALDLPEPWYLMIVPPCHVSTGEIFNTAELTRDAAPIKIRDFLAAARSKHNVGGLRFERAYFDNDYEKYGNAFEPVVRRLYPDINKIFGWLSDYAQPRLTGTGACIFAEFESEKSAEEVARRLPKQWRGFVAKGMNVSPLQASII